MTAPLPAVFVQGLAVVSSDNLNTFVQTVTNFAQLRTFTGLTSMLAIVQGGASPGDGLGGTFWYSAASVATDNGATVIVPTGAVSGAWLKLATVYSYQTPTTGFSIQVANGVTSLLLGPAGTLATGAVIFPVTPIDGQTLSISSSQTITALTLSAPTGQTILSAITTLAANGHTAWQYTASVSKWFRVS
jgi:hypothetical protein